MLAVLAAVALVIGLIVALAVAFDRIDESDADRAELVDQGRDNRQAAIRNAEAAQRIDGAWRGLVRYTPRPGSTYLQWRPEAEIRPPRSDSRPDVS